MEKKETEKKELVKQAENAIKNIFTVKDVEILNLILGVKK